MALTAHTAPNHTQDNGQRVRRQYAQRVAHFAVAFFGYYLQGKQDYAQYLTAQYVDSLESQVKLGLVWGPYKKQ